MMWMVFVQYLGSLVAYFVAEFVVEFLESDFMMFQYHFYDELNYKKQLATKSCLLLAHKQINKYWVNIDFYF